MAIIKQHSAWCLHSTSQVIIAVTMISVVIFVQQYNVGIISLASEISFPSLPLPGCVTIDTLSLHFCLSFLI